MKNKLRMMNFDKKLFFLCYVSFFTISLLVCLFNFAEDRILRATGRLFETTYQVENFEWVGLAEVNDREQVLVSLDADPRMLLEDHPEIVRRVDFDIVFSIDPGEFNIFYMPNENMEEFDPRYRVWAKKESDTQYSFALPRGTLYGLRVDPGIYGGNVMEFRSITFNQKQPITSFFSLGYTWLFYFLIIPALFASALRFAIEWLPVALKKKWNIPQESEKIPR